MKENYTHISVVLDRSGSMASMKDAVLDGFNSFLKVQKDVKGEATFTMVQFDDQYEVLHDMKLIKNVDELNSITFQPRGSTALLDAMGRTMTDIRTKLHSMKENERPSKVIFVFITDGQENASSEYKRKDIFEMIKDQRSEDNWEFVFIGANQDAIAESKEIGIRSSAALTFDASDVGAKKAFSSLTDGMTAYRCCKSSVSGAATAYAFSDADREEQEKLLGKAGKAGKKKGCGPIADISTKSL